MRKFTVIYSLAILFTGWVFLSSLQCSAAPEKETLQSNPLKESVLRGAVIYKDFCIQCHQANGEGQPPNFPPLSGADYLLNKREASIKAVKYGQQGEITVNGITYNTPMADLGLYNDEVADVMNYILNSWANKDGNRVTEEEVAAIQKD